MVLAPEERARVTTDTIARLRAGGRPLAIAVARALDVLGWEAPEIRRCVDELIAAPERSPAAPDNTTTPAADSAAARGAPLWTPAELARVAQLAGEAAYADDGSDELVVRLVRPTYPAQAASELADLLARASARGAVIMFRPLEIRLRPR
jgi:hypothetical protein